MTNDNRERDDEDGAFVSLDIVGDALDPATLIPVIPLISKRPKRKGDPPGRPFNGRVPVAKTGYCGFSTAGMAGDGNDHVACVLRAIEPRIDDIRHVMATYGLQWSLEFFEGETAGYRFTDLKPELFAWAERLRLKLTQAEEGNVTFVTIRTAPVG